jgi:hypothetical protein
MKTLTIIIAWTWITVPLGWGVYQSIQMSRPLFGMEKPNTFIKH